VRKFLQFQSFHCFQINTNITAAIITFVTALAAASEELALRTVQHLWINLIMNTFAALRLAPATDLPSRAILTNH
jgi:Ca2+-transporting ATPase